jgi:hypothetical protein
MATIALHPAEYNALRVRAAIATRPDPPGSAQERRPRNGNRGAWREIAGPANPAPATRMNTGDPQGVSVTPGRQGGRPRRYASPAEGNRARQRAYRARHRGQTAGTIGPAAFR